MRYSTELVALYHAHHCQQPEDISFWVGLAEERGAPVLELGCGSGRVALALARAGYSTYGLDREAGMLAYLAAQVEAEIRPRLHIFQADLTQFHLAQRFPLIILPCNTYSTLSPGERRSALHCAARHLQAGGCFAVSLPNPAGLADLPSLSDPELEAIFPHPWDGEPVQVSAGWRRSAGQIIFDWHYDHLLPDGRVSRHSLQVYQNLTTVEVYLEEFLLAGLKPAFLYGDYQRLSYSPAAPHLILGVTHTGPG